MCASDYSLEVAFEAVSEVIVLIIFMDSSWVGGLIIGVGYAR